MTAWGLSTTGFYAPSLAEVIAVRTAAYQAQFGISIDLTPTSDVSKEIAINSEREFLLYQMGLAVYASQDPDQATGDALVAVSAITGTIPKPASSSTVTLTATGTPGTLLVTGRTASVVTIGTKFDTLADGTIAAATAWAGTTAYVVGNYRTNGGNMYVCITAGTSAGSGGPTTTAADITDGTVHWRYLGLGTGYVAIAARAQATGPKIAVSGTLTVIETPVSGWSGVMNELDASLGRDIETDAELRARREDELPGDARSPIDAIRVHLLEDVPTISGVIVFENTSDVTNSDGLPPHSVEAMVQYPGSPIAATDQAIVDSLFANVAAGITTYGGVTGTHVDPDNGPQSYTIKFSRPTTRTIYVTLAVIKDPAIWPTALETQLKDTIAANIVAYGNTFKTGHDVVSSALKAQAFGTVKLVGDVSQFVPIPGVLDVTSGKISLTVTPTVETTLVMALRDLPVFDTSRIIVNLTDGTP